MKGFEPVASKKQSPLTEIGDDMLHWASKSHHPLLTNGKEEGGGEANNQSEVRPTRRAGQDGLHSNLNFFVNEGISKNNKLSTDFEAIIEELDEDISEG